MSIWGEHKPVGSGGDYLKLKSGERKKVRFTGEPAVVTYDGVKLRYQVVLYNKSDNVAQIYEFGPQVFTLIGDLYEDWGEPTDFDMTISRQGSTQYDTSYSVNPLPKSEDLTKEQLEAVAAVKFPTSKSKLLSEYEKDHIMPETIETKNKTQYATSEEELKSLEDAGQPLDLDDLPEGM